VPLLTAYVLGVMENAAKTGLSIVTPGAIDSTLPRWLTSFFVDNRQVADVFIIIALTMIIFQMMRYVLIFFEGYLRGKLKESVGRDIRNDLYNHIQDLSFRYHNKVDTGDLIQRVTSDVDTSTEFLSEGLGEAIWMIVAVASSAVQVFLIEPKIALIALIALPINIFFPILYFKKIDKLNEENEKAESQMTVVIQENLQCMKIVKAFGNEKYEIAKLDEKSQKFRDKTKKVNYISAWFWSFMDLVGYGEYSAVLIASIVLSTKSVMSFTEVIACIGLIGGLIWPLRGLGRLVGSLSKSNVAMGRLSEIFQEKSEFLINGQLKPPIFGNIEFRHVYFKFPDSDDYLIDDMSFTIKGGQTVAFIGRTGSGKSTIINLLLRMYEITSGEILIDGVSIKDIEKHYLRRMIGTVFQEPFLYSKSIRQNIAIASVEATEEQIILAAQISQMAEEIANFKDGYETIVGEKGSSLSGGQKQRLSIARVLVETKPLLIFDDALSALDSKTDLEVRQAIRNHFPQQSMIIITHRITTAKEADQIIVIDKNKVEAIGNHESLKNQPGLYQKLWDIQGKLESEFYDLIAKESHV
jgi:ATP-binding cassette subfamily B protein